MKNLKMYKTIKRVAIVALILFVSLLVLLTLVTPVFIVDGARLPVQTSFLYSGLILLIGIAASISIIYVCRYSIRKEIERRRENVCCTIENLINEIAIAKSKMALTDSNQYICAPISEMNLTDGGYFKSNILKSIKKDIAICFSTVFYIVSELSVVDLTEDDFLYCALSILGCKNDKISIVTRWSGNAIKSRLYHIKQKMTAELFETLLNS